MKFKPPQSYLGGHEGAVTKKCADIARIADLSMNNECRVTVQHEKHGADGLQNALNTIDGHDVLVHVEPGNSVDDDLVRARRETD